MERDVAAGVGNQLERYFGRLDGVGGGELEAQAVDVGGWIDGVVEDADVHCPFAEVGGADEGDAGWEVGVDLEWMVSWRERVRCCAGVGAAKRVE